MQFSIPDTFNPDHSEKYLLTIRLYPEGFAFSLYDPLCDGSYFYREISYNKKISPVANLKEIFFDNEFLAFPYRKTQVISQSRDFTFVPSILFKETDKDTFFSFNFHQPKGKLLNQQLQQPEINIIFSMEEEVYEFLSRSLSQTIFIHHTSPLISFFYHRSRLGNTNKLIVNIQKDSVDILCFSLGELILANNYSCQNTNDMVFYILFIWKHLKMNQLKDMAIVLGTQDRKTEVMDLLNKYIKNVVPFNPVPEHHLFGVDSSNIPFDIISLSLCEL